MSVTTDQMIELLRQALPYTKFHSPDVGAPQITKDIEKVLADADQNPSYQKRKHVIFERNRK